MQSQTAAASARLALLFDWFFYDADRDGIMNVEPAILILFNQLNKLNHPVAVQVIDFLVRVLCTMRTFLFFSIIDTVYG